jgi:hypothetical protein
MINNSDSDSDSFLGGSVADSYSHAHAMGQFDHFSVIQSGPSKQVVSGAAALSGLLKVVGPTANDFRLFKVSVAHCPLSPQGKCRTLLLLFSR